MHSAIKINPRFLIAQRVSTVLNADQILVLEEGKCVGLATHEELLVTCDSYRDLYELQLGGGRDVTT
jgi:ATP-binding cassette subfamily B multidrug efflux pump